MASPSLRPDLQNCSRIRSVCADNRGVTAQSSPNFLTSINRSNIPSCNFQQLPFLIQTQVVSIVLADRFLDLKVGFDPSLIAPLGVRLSKELMISRGGHEKGVPVERHTSPLLHVSRAMTALVQRVLFCEYPFLLHYKPDRWPVTISRIPKAYFSSLRNLNISINGITTTDEAIDLVGFVSYLHAITQPKQLTLSLYFESATFDNIYDHHFDTLGEEDETIANYDVWWGADYPPELEAEINADEIEKRFDVAWPRMAHYVNFLVAARPFPKFKVLELRVPRCTRGLRLEALVRRRDSYLYIPVGERAREEVDELMDELIESWPIGKYDDDDHVQDVSDEEKEADWSSDEDKQDV